MATVRTLMEDESLQLSLVAADRQALDRSLAGAFITDLPDPTRFLHAGVVVLTSGLWARDTVQADQFMTALAGSDVGALVIGLVEIGLIPDHVIRLARDLRIPLLTTGDEVAFASLAEAVESTASLGPAVPLQRLLELNAGVTRAVADGVNAAELLVRFAADAAIGAWHLDLGGRLQPPGAPHEVQERARGLAARVGQEQELFSIGVSGRRLAVMPLTGRDGSALGALLMDIAASGLEPVLPTLAKAVRLALATEQIASAARNNRLQALLTEFKSDVGGTGAAARIAFEGGNPTQPVTVVSADAAGVTGMALHVIERALNAAGIVIIAGVTADDEVVVLLHRDPAKPSPADALSSAFDRNQELFAGRRIRAGVSDPARVVHLADALEEARLRGVGAGGLGAVVGADARAHSYQGLLQLLPHRSRSAFGRSILGPLLEHDQRHSGNLVESLSVFLECACAWHVAAEVLHVHPSTLRYRIKRVEEVTGRNLALAQDRADLQVALACLA